MNKKIRTNWPDLDKQDRQSLLNYVVGEIHTYVFGRKEGMYCNAILNKMNQAFVDILKYQWDGLLMDVVNKLFNGYQTMDMKMLLNGFKVLQMVYE